VPDKKRKSNSVWIAPALVAVGLALGLLASWPLPKYITTGVPYTMAARSDERVAGMVQGDHLQYMYHLGQLRFAAEGHAPWFRNTYEFAGEYGFTEIYAYFPTALVYWPLSYVSEAFAFNAIVLLSFVGTMIAGYGLARAWGANRGGAFCAGIVLTLFPSRLGSLLGGHPAGSAFFLFPMAWWGLEKNWRTGRAAWGWLAAACFVVLARLEPHHLFYFCFLLPLWAFWKLAEAGTFSPPSAHATASRKWSLREAWPAVGAALLCAGCVHYNQVRLHVVAGFGPQLIALVVFFLLAVLTMRWLIERVVGWLGVRDEALRRRWLMLPWFAFWLLALYFISGVIDRPKYGLRLVRASVALFVIAHLVFLVVAAGLKRLAPGRITLPWRQIIRMWPAAVGLAVGIVYELYLKFALFDKTGVKGGRTLHEVRLFSVKLKALLSTTAGNAAYVGWALVLVAFASLALLLVRRRLPAGSAERRRIGISTALFLIGAVLTCGPLLSAYFPLYETLYNLVPFFNFTRATSKYAILTATFGSVMLALLTSRAFGQRLRGILLYVALAIVVSLDYTAVLRPGVSVLPVRNEAYAHVSEHSNGAPLLEVPVWPGDSAHSAIYQYWTLRTKVPTINGYSPTVPQGYIEHVSWPLYDLNYGRFGPREAALCDKLRVRFINFHEEVFPRKVAAFPAAQSLKTLLLNPRLRPVAEEGPIHLFEILDTPDARAATPSPLLTRYVPADHLRKQVGTPVDDSDAIDGRAWASDGRAGQLFYGPFAVLPTGRYVAVFRIKAHAEKPGHKIGALDIYAKRDKTPLPDRPLALRRLSGAQWTGKQGYRFVEIPFELEGTWVIETRGRFAGTRGTSLALDYVFIQSVPDDGPVRIEAEEMFHVPARLAKAPTASQGFCLEFRRPLPDGEPILEERYVLLDAGEYRLNCRARGAGAEVIAQARVRRVRAESASDESVIHVDVTAAGSPGQFAEGSGRFRVADRGVYAVSVWAVGKGLEAVDTVEIVPAD